MLTWTQRKPSDALNHSFNCQKFHSHNNFSILNFSSRKRNLKRVRHKYSKSPSFRRVFPHFPWLLRGRKLQRIINRSRRLKFITSICFPIEKVPNLLNLHLELWQGSHRQSLAFINSLFALSKKSFVFKLRIFEDDDDGKKKKQQKKWTTFEAGWRRDGGWRFERTYREIIEKKNAHCASFSFFLFGPLLITRRTFYFEAYPEIYLITMMKFFSFHRHHSEGNEHRTYCRCLVRRRYQVAFSLFAINTTIFLNWKTWYRMLCRWRRRRRHFKWMFWKNLTSYWLFA